MEKEIADFLEYLRTEKGYSDNTTAAYKNDLSQFYQYLRQNTGRDLTSWRQVGAETVEDYVDQMTASSSYAPSSIARKVAALKSFFHHLESKKRIDEDPTADIDSPKVEKRLPKTLSSADVESLLAAPQEGNSPKHLRDTALLHLLYATGMRVTELVSLRLEDINLEAGELECPGKDGQRRILPFDEETRQILTEYLEHGRPYLAKNEHEHALFLNHRGQQLTRQGLWLIIKAYARQADLSEAVTPHTLRHSFASHKLESGAELQRVQKLLGHANISTTQIYAQLTDEADDDEGNGGDGDDNDPAGSKSESRPETSPQEAELSR